MLQIDYTCIYMLHFRLCCYLQKGLSPNTQPPLILTLVLQNDLLACTNTSSLPKHSNPVAAPHSVKRISNI